MRCPRENHVLGKSDHVFSLFRSSFEDFKNVTKRFPRDVAYQLIYKRLRQNKRKLDESSITQRDPNSVGSSSSAAAASEGVVKKKPLRADLKMNVDKDNMSFLR